ncbi:MAG: glycosyltransferase [Acetobacteraceae bacterium]
MASERDGGVRYACDRAAAALQRGELAQALRCYEYAQRLAPMDAEITLSIGATLLSMHDPRAAAAFASIAAREDVQDAWLGAAASHHGMNAQDAAARDLSMLLSRHGHVRGAANTRLHDAIATAQGEAGWCALSGDGRLHVTLLDPAADMNRLVVLFDGTPLGVRPRRCTREADRVRAVYLLPAAWRQTSQISACLKGRTLLGSPLEAAIIGQVEGFVSVSDGGLTGWAWLPHDPDCPAAITLEDAKGTTLRVLASEPAGDVRHPKPLARPRRLQVPAADLRALIAPIAVQDAGGRNLYGSPLDPSADRRSAAGAAELARRLFPAATRRTDCAIDLRLPAVPADIVGVRPCRRIARTAGVDVVIPVYRGREQTLACIRTVLASLPEGARCIVVDDASPEIGLADALQDLAQRGQIVLRRQPRNRGFPATANAGIRAARDRDVILLNSDTLVPPGWIERLAEAAYSGVDIGTVTPLSNDATVFSYPCQDGPNAIPDEAATLRFDRLAQRANGHDVVDVPTAHGFCVYLRRDCIKEVGLLREDLFAQGYGEENDFSIRARHLGWRHVAAAGVFVAHAGAGSFGSAKAELLARNLTILNRLHPGYDALIATFRQADPLAHARFQMDARRWRRQRSRKGAVVLITHARGGGVKRHVAERCAAIAASGLRPIVLTPARTPRDTACCTLADATGEEYPNLSFEVGAGLAELAAFLRDDRPQRVELHHFLGHDPAVLGLAQTLGVPYDVAVHDYSWVCPRITLVGPDKRYCGEPGGHACEACYADVGGNIEEDITPARLRQRSRGVLAKAQRVVVPNQDVVGRLRHYFPALVPVVAPWEPEIPIPPPPDRPLRRLHLRVAVVGAIGIEKGYEYLLACARHVTAYGLAIEFVVVGETCGDRRLLETGCVHITGRYEEAEAVDLIRAQDAAIGFLPALWPETWSYTLSLMWQAGLDVVAFDIGAPAERIRARGRGSLLPLGLSPAAACQALLAQRAVEEPALPSRRIVQREPVAAE